MTERLITNQGNLDKRLWYYSYLEPLGLMSLAQLEERCVNKKRCFVPIEIPEVTPGQLESINHSLACELVRRRILPEIEKSKLLPISVYIKSLSKRTRKLCNQHNIPTLGAAMKRCVRGKSFVPVSEKKFTITANYQLAVLLHRKGFITDEALHKVKRPWWKLLVPEHKQLGKDAQKYLSEIPRAWSEKTKEIICRAVTRKFRYNHRFFNKWESISVKELVMTFVRIDYENNPVFYTKGHYGPYRYNKDFFDEHSPQAYPEIRQFLEDMDYLPRPNQEEVDRRFVEE